MDEHRIDFEALPWENTSPGARFKSFRDSAKLMRIVEFTPEFVEPNWCEKGHIGIVLSGELEIDFHGKLVHYPAGSGIMIAAGPENGHKGHAITETVRLFLIEDV